MKTADEMVDGIALAVRPPRGIAIVLTECPGSKPNWAAATGIMDPERTGAFTAKVAALRVSDVIDWSRCEQIEGVHAIWVRLNEARFQPASPC